MPTERRRCGIFHLGKVVMSLPATQILPRVTGFSRSSMRMIVDLPDPDGPTRKNELPLLNIQGDVVSSNSATLIDLGYILEKNHGNKRSLAPRCLPGAQPGTLTAGL